MSLKKLAAGVALTTLAALAANGALAQTTASQVSEVVVTTGAQRSTGGLAVQTQVAKDQAIVTSRYIATQVGSTNVAQIVNLTPGVSYASDDSTGLLSTDIRIHGFDGSHISFTVDGTPLNDTGNYAVYPGEYPVSEVVDHETVNAGGNEVDSPSASALGATVNIVTKIPQSAPGFQGSATAGNYNYVRGYAEGDTGEFTPWGTRAYFSANYTRADKTKGSGDLKRTGFEGKIYQPLRDKDFISVSGTWVSERSYFYGDGTLQQYAEFGYGLDNNTAWAIPTAQPGKADGVGAPPASGIGPGFWQGNDGAFSNFWALHPNPVDFGDVRVQSRFDLSHGFTFTFDPYFFFTQANGGGTTAVKETDPRLVGNAASFPSCRVGSPASGVDLNGDGDCLDTVLLYSPSNTQTDRFGLNTSLLYDYDDHNHFQLAYTLDYGNHRQTGAFGTINQQTGYPTTVFGGLDGQGVFGADGTALRKRDRFSIAELNQVSFNYIGRWVDDRLHVNLGVRYAMFRRRLNQYCYLYNGTNEYCDAFSPSQIAGDLAADNANGAATLASGGRLPTYAPALSKALGVNVSYSATGQANFRLPFTQVLNYDQALPNLGASWNFDPQNQVYVSYTQGFAAPKTDDLYTSTAEGVKPETTDIYAGGYRYRGAAFTFSGSLWGTHWHNHIVSSIDPLDPTISIDRNIGNVTLYGIDAEGGYHVNEHVMLYASYTWEHSQLDGDEPLSAGGKAVFLPVKGKELVLTPDMMGSGRVEVTQGPFVLGVQGKYTGPRYTDDMNSQAYRIPGYATADVDATYAVPSTGGHVILQFNATNLFNTRYFARSTTVNSASRVTVGGVTYSPSTVFYYTGDAPSYRATVKVRF